MSSPSKFGISTLGDGKRFTFANKPSKPEVGEGTKVEAALTPQNFRPFLAYRTNVKVFIRSTGDDSGDMAELRGAIIFDYGGDKKDFGFDVPILNNWADKGYGLLQGEHSKDLSFIPASFRAALWEDDTFGNDIILDYRMDFNIPGNLAYAKGEEWSVTSSNSADNRYVANLVWQVTPL